MPEPIDLSGREQAWTALRMIREKIETLGPPDAILSEEAVITSYGPELIHEAQAFCDGLVRLFGTRGS